jgi:hypothetical protein
MVNNVHFVQQRIEELVLESEISLCQLTDCRKNLCLCLVIELIEELCKKREEL